MKLAAWQLATSVLPYKRPITWASAHDDRATYALLRLTADTGAVGTSEALLKLAWNGMTAHSLEVSLAEIVLPSVFDEPDAQPGVVATRLQKLPGNDVARTLVDMALWDLHAQEARQSLWQHLGGTDSVPVSWTVTRRPLGDMVTEAREMVERYGFSTLKLKGGQGLDFDVEMVRSVRAAVHPDVRLYVDANSKYPVDAVPHYAQQLSNLGVSCLEDPCRLRPLPYLRDLVTVCPIPILVDKGVSDREAAELFLEAGATSVSIKLPRVGISAALEIVALARDHDASVAFGMSTESSVGSYGALSVASAISTTTLPCECSFFLQLAEEHASCPLKVENGQVSLPPAPSVTSMVNWDKLDVVASSCVPSQTSP